MPLSKITSFTKKVTDLPDKPSPTYSASQIKDYILQPSNDLMSTVNGNVDALNNEFALKTELQNVVLGQIPDGTITKAKLAFSPLGINFYQNTEPTDYTQGSTWFNPDTGQLYVADGTKYQPIPPVQVLEEVVDFTETGITLTHNNTEVSNGSVQLGEIFNGTTAIRTDDTTSSSVTSQRGIRVNPNKNIGGIKCALSSSVAGATKAYLYQGTTQLTTVSITGSTFEIKHDMQSGIDYDVLVDNNGASYTQGYNTSPTFPYTSTDIDITAGLTGVNTSSATYAGNILSVQASSPATTGDVTIQWDTQPSDLKAWDLATYALTLDGETVTVDVESLDTTILGTTVSRPDDDGSGSTSYKFGIKIKPKINTSGLKLVFSSNLSGASKIYLYDATTQILLLESDLVNEFIYDFQANTEYYIVVDNSGINFTSGNFGSATFPYTSTDIDITGGIYINGTTFTEQTSVAYSILNVTPITSSWTPIFTDIDQNFDISTIDPTHQVRSKANLSRVDTNNNPTLDYVARRFVR